jgi:hypothetical protein
MKSVTVIHMGRGMGKTSIALTEYHNYRLLGQTMGFVLPASSDKRHTLPLANQLGVDITHTKIITSIDGIRGKRFNRLIIDDIDICSMKWGVSIYDIYNIYAPHVDKLLVTMEDLEFVYETLQFCQSQHIEYNIYRKADLVGYKIGYK